MDVRNVKIIQSVKTAQMGFIYCRRIIMLAFFVIKKENLLIKLLTQKLVQRNV